MKLLNIFLHFLNVSILVLGIESRCKCTPSDACWPSPAEWAHFNTTLEGALIRPVPPGSVCYPSQPDYDPKACAHVTSRWFDSSFHASHPASIDYPIWVNNTCNPIHANGTSITGDPDAGRRGCSFGNYPAYVVNASTSHHIRTAIVWAQESNIRVVVKSTGHSYQGRSTGYASLSIWTHHMRGIQYLPAFRPTTCAYQGSTLSALRVAAGHTNTEVQEEAAKHGKAVVTGFNPSVGLVGWLAGGGHGPLSSTYGMGADNLLEATIMTPDGERHLVNPCQNEKIFAAIRGGGGGTFGVITDVVVRAFPSPKTTTHVLQVRSLDANTSQAFYSFLAFLHTEMQRLKDGGMQGYYIAVGPPIVPTLSFSWTFMLYDKPAGTAEQLTAPIERYLNERKELFTWEVKVSHTDTYLDMHRAHFANEKVANGGSAYGSWLLSPKSLAKQDTTANVLAGIGSSSDVSRPNGPVSNPLLIGHMVASPKTPAYFPDSTSLNPAWCNTLTHFIVVSPFSDDTTQRLIDAVYADITHNKIEALRRLSPETGAYFNEADSYQPEWQKAFWGKGYAGLRRLKEEVDEGSLLWCRGCVGSEALVERADGRLCRVDGGLGHDEL